ncbi:hypothetical protein C9I57_27715 [Trinickia symbiotica]|uniref:Uncharacterized protein n=1 Tax=Trinickia symbiotica TaxID=863227 RepID=A0A2T3XLX8_9BURK|nr:hypothetical protein C9I57_27715 [Trinickia symbiotica]
MALRQRICFSTLADFSFWAVNNADADADANANANANADADANANANANANLLPIFIAFGPIV